MRLFERFKRKSKEPSELDRWMAAPVRVVPSTMLPGLGISDTNHEVAARIVAHVTTLEEAEYEVHLTRKGLDWALEYPLAGGDPSINFHHIAFRIAYLAAAKKKLKEMQRKHDRIVVVVDPATGEVDHQATDSLQRTQDRFWAEEDKKA